MSLVQTLESQVAAGQKAEAAASLKQIKQQHILHQTISHADYATAIECGILLAISDKDLDSVSLLSQQLQPLYQMLTTESPRKNFMTGLNLMALLVTGSVSEFHSELELLKTEDVNTDKYLQFPVAIERKLMVGIYDEILTMPVPDPAYQFFMDLLVETVQGHILDCMEVSYETLTKAQAAAMGATELRDDWIIEGDVISFANGEPTAQTAEDIPSEQWIQQSLTYATEMERIV